MLVNGACYRSVIDLPHRSADYSSADQRQSLLYSTKDISLVAWCMFVVEDMRVKHTE